MESSNITIYTCITGGKDTLIEDQPKGYKYIAFTDFPLKSDTWEIRRSYERFKDDRRNSRIQKILAHKYIDTEYSIYIDGNIRLIEDPKKLIEKHLKDHDIAVFKHPTRNCIYDEAIECAKRGLDLEDVIIGQVKDYSKNEYPKDKGLCECGVIFRRHNDKVEKLNNAWWAEYCVHSRRDQISFMYAVDRTATRINSIKDFFIESEDGRKATKQSGELEIVLHNHFI